MPWFLYGNIHLHAYFWLYFSSYHCRLPPERNPAFQLPGPHDQAALVVRMSAIPPPGRMMIWSFLTVFFIFLYRLMLMYVVVYRAESCSHLSYARYIYLFGSVGPMLNPTMLYPPQLAVLALSQAFGHTGNSRSINFVSVCCFTPDISLSPGFC